MGIYAQVIDILFPFLYSIRDWALQFVPVVGTYIADVIQWVINAIPLL